ncbi:DUF1731 domain-containing protein [Actinomadura soli]|uniref:DUF1731 domain-containing protein n=1 Tax=Actinomadura soli TaxID=2508997 RepID=UPI00197A9631
MDGEIGALAIRSDTELLLKSRRVVPGRLLDAGFTFDHAQWPDAAADLVRRVRTRRAFSAQGVREMFQKAA